MKTKNINSSLMIWLDLVFLIVFNLVFFIASGFEHKASVWISYAFIHFSYIMLLLTPIIYKNKSGVASLNFSIYSISSGYFIIEFIAGVIFILVNSDETKVALIVQIIIAGIYAVLLISNLIANSHTEESLAVHNEEVLFIKQASLQVKPLVDKFSDKRVNKKIEEVYDLLHSSPSKSNSTVKPLERSILDKISELKSVANSNDLDAVVAKADEIISVTKERNLNLQL